MKTLRVVATAQSIYYLITALWPIIDIESFMVVTGPKTDIWLVKTVGALLIPVSLTLLYFAVQKPEEVAALLLGSASAISFIVVDLYYSLNDTIDDIYQVDAAAQFVILAGWFVGAYGARQRHERHTT